MQFFITFSIYSQTYKVWCFLLNRANFEPYSMKFMPYVSLAMTPFKVMKYMLWYTHRRKSIRPFAHFSSKITIFKGLGKCLKDWKNTFFSSNPTWISWKYLWIKFSLTIFTGSIFTGVQSWEWEKMAILLSNSEKSYV